VSRKVPRTDQSNGDQQVSAGYSSRCSWVQIKKKKKKHDWKFSLLSLSRLQIDEFLLRSRPHFPRNRMT
jgi:hypothetical protein